MDIREKSSDEKRLIDADRALEIVRNQGNLHPNAHHLTRYATLILQEAPTITDLSKCVAFNSAVDGKPQTNADRIRAMSDEELDYFLYKVTYGMDECPHEYGSEKALEWLQQPAEGE